MFNQYLIKGSSSIIDALKKLDKIKVGPMVLFVINENEQMIGTLTDGDVRRALIAGFSINEEIRKIIRPKFNYLRANDEQVVESLRVQKDLNMSLVPVLDNGNHIVEIIDLEKYRTRLPIDAVLMAGGKGERLRPLTEKTPKPLLPVGGKAIIDHNIDRLIEYGIKNISVTVNYLKEQIEEHFVEPRNGVKVQTVREPEYLGTMGSVQFVKDFHNDTVLVMNSDLFTNIDYEGFYLHFLKNNADMSAAAVPYTVNVPYGIFNLDGRNVTGISEKPVFNYFANAGIYLIKRDILNKIPKGDFFNATDLMEKLISEKKKVIRYPITGFWLDIGSKVEYEKAQELVKHINGI